MVVVGEDARGCFRDRVEGLVTAIPVGRVMTYGDIAAWCGHPGAARQVGMIAASGSAGVPWHRVVLSGGRLARRTGADPDWQATALAKESIIIRDARIQDFAARCWHPLDGTASPRAY